MRVVDLFSGAGGFSLGLTRAGCQIVATYENAPIPNAVHAANLPKVPRQRFLGPFVRPGGLGVHREADLTDLLAHAPDIADLRPDVVVGGPPCQPFSRSGARQGDDDPRALLTEAYAVVVCTARPRYFVMENVPEVLPSQVYRRATSILQRAGYGLTPIKIGMQWFGVGQARKRLLLFGALGEADGWATAYVEAERQTRPTTVRDILGDDLPDVYYMYPGGSSSAGTRRSDEPGATITRRAIDAPGASYMPRPGDHNDVWSLPRLTFEQLAALAGYPPEWNWHPGPKRTPQEDRMIMIANSVPSPIGEMVGRILLQHRGGGAAAHQLPVVLPRGFRPWLRRRTAHEHLKQRMSEVRAALELLNGRAVGWDAVAAEARLERMPGFRGLGRGRKSNLRAALRSYCAYLESLSPAPSLADVIRSDEATQAEEYGRPFPAELAAILRASSST